MVSSSDQQAAFEAAAGSGAYQFSRRRALGVGAALGGLGGLGALHPGLWGGLAGLPQAAAADRFTTLRQRRADHLTGGSQPDSPPVRRARENLARTVAEIRQRLAGDGVSVFVDAPLNEPNGTLRTVNMGNSYSDLFQLALGFATPGLPSTGEPALAVEIREGLRLLADRLYHRGSPRVGNWWFWEIGVPTKLTSTLVLMFDQIAPELRASWLDAVASFAPNPNLRTGTTMAETGANRTDKALACAVRGILAADPATVALGRDALSDIAGGGRNSLFRYVTSGDGFYADGSFIQHVNIPYVGTYGNVALGGVADIIALLAGSEWEITDPNRTVIFDAVDKSFAPFIWNGRMMDTVRGRAVSRQRERDFHDGFTTIGTLLVLAGGVPEPWASRYRSLARGWIDRCSVSYSDTAPLARLAAANALLADPAVVPAPETPGHLRFPAQERSVHRRPGWAFTLSTCSTRIARYETGNGENIEGWYQGDGMTYFLVAGDQDHYADEYWPTLDPMRLPGTTIRDVPRSVAQHETRGFTRYAGGVELDGYGLIGNDQLDHAQLLQAKKSWFCLDDRVVCLGAGIGVRAGQDPVLTTIEQRNLGADPTRVAARSSAGSMPRRPGERVLVPGPAWFSVPGTGGFLLLDESTVSVQRSERSGAWSRINTYGDTRGDDQLQTRPYLTMTIDHGRGPTDAGYAYAVLPGADTDTVRAAAAQRQTRILANTPTVQAIRHGELLLATFFAAADAGEVAADAACAVVLRRAGDRIRVAVSDPSRGTATLRLTLPGIKAGPLVAADSGVRLIPAGEGSILEVPLANSSAARRTAEWVSG